MKYLKYEIALMVYLIGALGTFGAIEAMPPMPLKDALFYSVTWPVTWIAVITYDPHGGM